MMDHNEPDNKPMFKKEITLGNVLSLIVVMGTVFSAWFHQEERSSIIETAYAAHVVADDKQNAANDTRLERIEKQLDRIESKLTK
jgi:hypothetical protein